MTHKRSLRFLQRRVQDESGDTWDRFTADWIPQSDLNEHLSSAFRVLVHEQAYRRLRDPALGEIELLRQRVSSNGRSGSVVAAEYINGSRSIVVLSIVD